MGLLVDGEWKTDWYATDQDGRFRRPKTQFREWIGDEKGARFAPEAGRYHLYVSYACPWAHRTLVTRAVLGLGDAVSLSIVDPLMGDDGWAFSDAPGTIPDTVNGARYLRDIYLKADTAYTGRVSVPVLWDRKEGTIVNNESREVMRMLDTAMAPFAKTDQTLLPEGMEAHVDGLLDAIYEPINNGVYRAGFATSQDAYEAAVGELFDALHHFEVVLGEQRYLAGEVITEADVAMYTTLVRFDLVYYSHFKCNVARIADLPNLRGYLRDLYQTPGIAEIVFPDLYKHGYFSISELRNPLGIVPKGPLIDFTAPHGRRPA